VCCEDEDGRGDSSKIRSRLPCVDECLVAGLQGQKGWCLGRAGPYVAGEANLNIRYFPISGQVILFIFLRCEEKPGQGQQSKEQRGWRDDIHDQREYRKLS
jgi:hypothetical protein